MKDEIKPILVVPAVPFNGGIRFLMPSDQIDIDSSMAEDLWKIIGSSNGYNNIEDIIKETKLEKEFVSKIVQELMNLKIMYDSRELYMHFNEITYCPDTYFRNLKKQDIYSYTNSKRKEVKEGVIEEFKKDNESSVSKLIFSRRSCRSFSSEELNKEIIGNICYNGYSISNHAVPSGGGLYPLKIYVLVEKKQNDLKEGYYEYDAERDVLVRFNDNVDVEQLKYCFDDEILPFSSNVQIVIAADLRRQTYKYSNRGYRLTLIEAGQVAQNISLYCTEHNIGTCELGGVLDEPLIKELNLEEIGISPILSIAIGRKSNEEQYRCYDFKDSVEEMFVGEDKEIKQCWNYYFGKDAAFFGACSIYGKDDKCSAGATASSYPQAIAKSIIEGYERKQSGNIRTDYYGKAKDITTKWLNPYTIRPLDDSQIKQDKVNKFTDELPISWTKAVRLNTKEEILVPSDLIYYGTENVENRIFYTDSSGIAAHTDWNKALKSATLELIERDAIVRNWFAKVPPEKISEDILPVHVRNRIQYWRKRNREVYVLDMNSTFLPTVQVVIVGEEYPCFVSGAASYIENPEEAVLKALREAEFTILLKEKYPDNRRIKPEEVKTPDDHGQLYAFNDYIENIKWLWNSSEIKKEYSKAKYTFEEILKLLDVILVDISEEDREFKVLRVFSEKCIPISFGYGMDLYTHSIAKDIICDDYKSNIPHYFA